MNSFEKVNDNTPVWLVVCLILLNNFWSFTGFDLKFYQICHLFVLVYFIYIIVHCRKSIIIPKSSHKVWILMLIITPLLSIISGYVLLGRSFFDSFVVYRMHLGYLLYFVLWYKKVTMGQLIKVISIVAFGYVFLTLFQQVTYPSVAPFGNRAAASPFAAAHGGFMERRLGFYRFDIMGVLYAVVLAVLVFSKRVKMPVVLKVLLFVSIIASGNRRIIFITGIGVSLCWFLKTKSYKKWLYLFVGLSLLGIAYTFRYELFGDLANWEEDLENGREHSYVYYFAMSLYEPMATWMGWGVSRDGDGTSDFFDKYVEGKTVILADIGLVACLFYWGLLYVISLVGLFVSLSLNKRIFAPFRSIALGILAILWVYFISWEVNGSSFIALLVYACDLSIVENANGCYRKLPSEVNPI